jgi:Pro-kumamolisin, activation domain/Bacterial Ig-like domain (group 3)
VVSINKKTENLPPMKLPHVVLSTSLSIFVISLTVAAPGAMGQSTQAVTVPPRVTQAIDETQMVTLKGNVHPMARAGFDQGAAADAAPMSRMLLVLRRSAEQEAALQSLMEAQQSKESASFHQWLTPGSFAQQFGPADADMHAIQGWLASQGFQNIKATAGGLAIEFSGNAGQVRNAFHTEIHNFLVSGKVHQANVSDPQIPAALAPVVAGIASLNNFSSKSARREVGAFMQKDGSVVPEFTGGSGPYYALGPADFAKIYNIPTTVNGSGSKIAIAGVSDINPQDITDFRNLFGLPANAPNVIYNGPDPGMNDGESEADLDVEWSGAIAQNAHIDFVVSQGTTTTDPVVLSALYVIDNNSDDILSASFSNCEQNLGSGGNALMQALWEQAAAQGITVVVSTGDAGSAGCDNFDTEMTATLGLGVSGFASTPFNIAVGGTDFDDAGKQSSYWSATNAVNTRESALGYIPETTWNDSCAATAASGTLNTVCASPDGIAAASGGISGLNAPAFTGYAKPSFQNGITPADAARDIPDVSLYASDGPNSKSFYVVCQADKIQAGNPPSCEPGSNGFSFIAGAGTSASAPSFAGILALIEQSERNRVPGSGGRQGNANYVLYKLAATAGNFCNSTTQPLSPPTSCVFYDITKGNNSVPCAGGSPDCSASASGSNGVLVNPSQTTTPAWTTTSGYDYATGLGSVNVGNLISKWGGAVGTFRATTAALTLNGGTSTITITHGGSVTAGINVAPQSGTGTPTGDVSLLAPASAGDNEGGNGATLTAGAASFATTTLPGGSYTVTGHYTGDGTFSPSDSNGVRVVVNKENSGLQAEIATFDPATGKLTNANATTFTYGSSYVLRFDILNSSGHLCQPLTVGGTTTGCAVDATGTVTITDNGASLDAGSFVLNSTGNGEDQTIQLLPGTHAVALNYSGDNSYNASGPTNLSLTVNRGATTTTLMLGTGSYAVGYSIPVTMSVSTTSNGVVPSCTALQLFDGMTDIGVGGDCGVANSGGVVTVSLVGGATLFTPGIHTLTATYPQDAYYATSSSSPQSLTIKLPTFLLTTAIPTQILQGQTTTLTTVVDTGKATAAVPTGTVQFSGVFNGKVGTPVSCTPTTDASGNQACKASLTFSPKTSDAFSGTYSGDANYSPPDPNSSNENNQASVTIVQPGISITGTNATVTAGGTGSSTITITPLGFTGNVMITCPTWPGITCSPLTINETSATVPATGVLTFTVAPPSSATTASILPAGKIYVAGVVPSGSKPWWPWTAGAGIVALGLLFPGRRRIRAVVLVALMGLVGLTVSCGGGGGSAGGGGGGTTAVATTTQLTVSSTKVALNGPLNLSATVTGGTPIGTVAFVVDGAAGYANNLTNGSTGNIPTMTTGNFGIGTHTVVASYSGAPGSAPSQSGALNVAVTGSTVVQITGTSTNTSSEGRINVTVN